MKYLLFLLLIPQCKTARVDKRDFKIRLNLSSFKEDEKFYIAYANTNKSVNEELTDSTTSSGKILTFNGKIDEPGPATIYRYTEYSKEVLAQMKKLPGITEEDMKEILSVPMREEFAFFLMPGEITITAKRSLYTSAIGGPKEVLDFDSLKKEDNGYILKHLSAGDKLEMGIIKPDAALKEKMMKKWDSLDRLKKDQVYLNYTRMHPSSPLALYALKQSIPVRMDSAEKYLQVFYQMPAEMQHWPSAAIFKATLEATKNAEIGQFIKDFKQTDSLGKIVTFSSFKGRYVLLDLWASWCIPCRQKHPELVTVFKKYNRENFTILGIALEEEDDKSRWLKAIQQDKLLWTQVTDFKGWDNIVARQFGVRAIPFNLLVDPEGKIIDKNLSPSDLEKRLAILFNK